MLTKIVATNIHALTLELPFDSDLIALNPLQVRNVQGLGPVKATISTLPFGSVDGESYMGSSVGKRNIILTIGLNPNWVDQSIESLRALLYQFFMAKAMVNLQFFTTHLPTVQITGYVESFEPNIFSKDPEIQISIICPDPDFVAIASTVVTGIVDDNVIGGTVIGPYDHNYTGTMPTGFTLKVESSVARPTYTGFVWTSIINLADSLNRTFIEFTGTINTTAFARLSSEKGNKYAKQFAVSSGLQSADYLSTVTFPGAIVKWPELLPGSNRIVVQEGSTGQIWTLTYFARFGGL